MTKSEAIEFLKEGLYLERYPTEKVFNVCADGNVFLQANTSDARAHATGKGIELVTLSVGAVLNKETPEETKAEEVERLAKEEAAKAEAEKLAAVEAAKAEAEKLATEEAAKAEAEKLAAVEAAKAEAEKLATEEAGNAEAEKLAAEEAAKAEAEKKETKTTKTTK